MPPRAGLAWRRLRQRTRADAAQVFALNNIPIVAVPDQYTTQRLLCPKDAPRYLRDAAPRLLIPHNSPLMVIHVCPQTRLAPPHMTPHAVAIRRAAQHPANAPQQMPALATHLRRCVRLAETARLRAWHGSPNKVSSCSSSSPSTKLAPYREAGAGRRCLGAPGPRPTARYRGRSESVQRSAAFRSVEPRADATLPVYRSDPAAGLRESPRG